MKKISMLIMSAILGACLLATFAGEGAAGEGEKEISIIVDGQVIDSDVAPYLQNGRTMVPFRFVAEALGCEVEWYEEDQSQSVCAKGNGREVYLYIGESFMLADGIEKELDAAAVIRNGRTFVPLRAISEALGFQVGWDQNKPAVLITTSGGGTKALLTPENAALAVQRLPEVRDLLLGSSPGTIHLELVDEFTDRFVFRVYEVVEDEIASHTATYGWYEVDKDSGRVNIMVP